MSKPMLPNEAFIAAADSDITLPDGWTVDDLNEPQLSSYKQPEEFAKSIQATLPEAARTVEQLVAALYAQLDIYVPVTYMVINSDTDFHIFLLVDETTYHSPHRVAADLLCEKYTGMNSNISLRFMFTIDRQHHTSYLTTNQYVAKYEYRIS